MRWGGSPWDPQASAWSLPALGKGVGRKVWVLGVCELQGLSVALAGSVGMDILCVGGCLSLLCIFRT